MAGAVEGLWIQPFPESCEVMSSIHLGGLGGNVDFFLSRSLQ